MQKALDRINEAYYGSLGESLQIKTRNRIHWIVNHVQGREVLDIGCSQGIVSILVGREGKKVTGIDILQESIDFAIKNLSNEPDAVKQNINFICDNFITKIFNYKFDTIVASEVLEHIGDVRAFLAKIRDLLVSDGKLVVTVPFGINDYFDHKRTYYFYEIMEQLAEYFYIDKLEFLGKWLGIVCINTTSDFKINHYIESYIKDFEEAIYQIERDYINDINVKDKRINSLLDEKKQVLQKLTEANDKCRIVRINIDEYKARELNFQKQISDADKHNAITEENKVLIKELTDYKEKIQQLNTKSQVNMEQMQVELAKLQLHIEDKEAQISRNEETFKQLNEKINKSDDENKQLIQNYANLDSALKQNEQSFTDLNIRYNKLAEQYNVLNEHEKVIGKKYSKLVEENENYKANNEKLEHEYFDVCEKLKEMSLKYTNLEEENNKYISDYKTLEQKNNNIYDKLNETESKYKGLIAEYDISLSNSKNLTEETRKQKAYIQDILKNEVINLEEQEKYLNLIRKLQNDLSNLKKSKMVRLSYKYWGFINRMKKIFRRR
jgi:2-polyprenyl-3-methyl-5-hydroxy-6-metoxy-1,4-benzoquinol methylase/predicted nuclease with TOPRIM domain